MIENAKKRAKRECVEKLVMFIVCDVKEIPFKDNQFDVVISESVTSFIRDKEMILKEYVRITKFGGLIALNESTW